MTDINQCEPFLASRRRKSSLHEEAEDDFWSHGDDWTVHLKELGAAMGVILQDAETAARLGLLEQRLRSLEETQVRRESLTSLAGSGLAVKKQIPISINFNGDDFIATFFDAKISATGDTAAEALWNIKDILVLKFKRLIALPEASLGPMPRTQLAVLREFIGA